MDRTPKSIRAARDESSPYRREQPKQSQSIVRSFMSRLNPWASTKSTSDLPVEVEQMSESGSEVESREPSPVNGRAVDLFALAGRPGRNGHIEEVQAEVTARKEVKDRHSEQLRRSQELRRELQRAPKKASPFSHPFNAQASSSTNGLSHGATASTPAGQKRARSSSSSFQAPTSSFRPSTPSGPCARALAAFLSSTGDETLSPDQLDVLSNLSQAAKNERAQATPNKAAERLGAWSAAQSPRARRPLVEGQSTPVRATRSAVSTPGSTFSVGSGTPVNSASTSYRQKYLGPGMSPRRMTLKPKSTSAIKPLFSLDTDESATKKRKIEDKEESQNADATRTPSKGAATNGLSKTVSLPNFFAPSTPVTVQPATQKSQSKRHPLAQSTVAAASSSPDVVPASPKPADPVAVGLQRSRSIAQSLVDDIMAEIGTSTSAATSTAQKQPKQQDTFTFNPYAKSSTAAGPSTPAKGTPRKSILRHNDDTPKRGAAARLDMQPASRPLTTIEAIQGVKPWEAKGAPGSTSLSKASPPKHVRLDLPEKEKDDDDVEQRLQTTDKGKGKQDVEKTRPTSSSTFSFSFGYKPASAPNGKDKDDSVANGDKAKGAAGSAPTPFVFGSSTNKSDSHTSAAKPVAFTFGAPTAPETTSTKGTDAPATSPDLVPPTFARSTTPITTPRFTPSEQSFGSVSQQAVIDFSERNSPEPVFKPSSPPAPWRAPEEPASAPTVFRIEENANRTAQTFVATRITPQDVAMKVPKEALPFFTFTIPTTPSIFAQADADKAKADVLKHAARAFDFVMPEASHKVKKMLKQVAAKDWTCDTCMLKNAGTTIDQCTICEAPRPANTLPKAHGSDVITEAIPFQYPNGVPRSMKPRMDTWTCESCGNDKNLQNGDIEETMCWKCEAPKIKEVE